MNETEVIRSWRARTLRPVEIRHTLKLAGVVDWTWITRTFTGRGFPPAPRGAGPG